MSVLIHETLETSTIDGTTFIVRPLNESPITGRTTFSFDDVLTFTPDAPLSPNTTYEVVFPDGGIKDAAGNGMVGYSFTFSTGASVGGNAPPLFNSVTASANPAAPGATVELDLATNLFTEAIDLDNSDSATAVAHSPLGDYLFVTLQGTNDVVVLDPLLADQVSGLGRLVTRWSTGLAPQGICGDPVTNRMFVTDFMDRTTTTLETATFFQTGDKTVAATAISAVANEALSAQDLLGKQIFYNSGDPRMSAVTPGRP